MALTKKLTDIANAIRDQLGGQDPLNLEQMAEQITAFLNMRVVGNPCPADPGENTVWVNTDRAITNFIISAQDPNRIDYETWRQSTAVSNGAKTVNADGSITLTANTSGDCFTDYTSAVSRIPVVPGKTYLLQWAWSGDEGRVYLFKNGSASQNVRTQASEARLEIEIPQGCTFVTFRIGVTAAGGKATYAAIRFTELGETVQEGTVWISTAASGDAAFNALRKNGIMVCPLTAKQYLGGVWTKKDAKSCQNGAWVDWYRYLYKKGTEYTAVTGGWTAVGKKVNSGTEGGSACAPTVTQNTGSFTLSNPANWNFGMYHSKQKIDLSGCSALIAEVSNVSTGGGSIYLGVWSAIGTYLTDNRVAISSAANGTSRLSVDLSNVADGTYYVGFVVGSGTAAASVTVSNVKYL